VALRTLHPLWDKRHLEDFIHRKYFQITCAFVLDINGKFTLRYVFHLCVCWRPWKRTVLYKIMISTSTTALRTLFSILYPIPVPLTPLISLLLLPVSNPASEMTCIVSSGALNSTHSLTCIQDCILRMSVISTYNAYYWLFMFVVNGCPNDILSAN